MPWEVEYTDEFGEWWDSLTAGDWERIRVSVILLEQLGPNLGYPHSSKVNGTRNSHLRELRVQSKGQPFRVLYAFDPRRVAILLLGGDKTGDDRWYEVNVPRADKLYDRYIAELRREGHLDG